MHRKLTYSVAIVVAVFAFCANTAFAYTSPGTPNGYVNDFGNVLSEETEASLELLLAQVEASSTSEIAVVTVATHGTDETIESYAVKLFEEYGIGQAKEDNGVLLLIAVNDKSLRIEVGYGLEGALPDFVAKSIIDNEMVPYLRDGDFDTAATVGVSKIQEAIAGEYVAENTPATVDDSWFEILIYALFIIPQWFVAVVARSKDIWAGGIFGALFGGVVWFVLGSAGLAGIFMGGSLFAFFVALGFLLDYYISRSYKEHTSRGDSIPWWAGGSSGGSGGSSSSGGSFGGGSSGGGGASGSW